MKTWSIFCMLVLLSINFMKAQDRLCLMFYNLENYFDCEHDSLKNDYAFLPDGDYHWTWHRFWKKTHQLAKVMVAVGNKGVPEIMGFSEIENEQVLCTLMKAANIENTHRYVYEESLDGRGIDVCFVYHRYFFKVLNTEKIRVIFPRRPEKQTRYMLYVHGICSDSRELHFFICHWPSRYGGSMSSEASRCRAAEVLRAKVDSVFRLQSDAQVVIMGDFNDEPEDKSIRQSLKVLPDTSVGHPKCLYNLMWQEARTEEIKSHKYQGTWAMFDQMIVSTALYASLRPDICGGVFREDFLLIPDEKYMGVKPFRTYHGYSYQGGYSDHLPVYLYLPLMKK